MAYTTINKSTDYFNTKLYTGTDANLSITAVNFRPDLTWIKSRSATGAHQLMDAVRGASKRLASNSSGSEDATNGLLSFDTDGFSMGDSATSHNMNGSGVTYASWNWLGANGTATNYDGSITSTVSANTTAGFSIVTYTGTGSSATIGHGLGASPDVVIIKKTSAAEDWNFQTSAIGYGNYLVLNGNGASSSAGGGLVSAVSSTTVTVDSNSYVNSNGATYVMYCFAEKKGYSKFGSYTGNGNADGTFVYTGFKPAFVMVKRTDTTADWHIDDAKRNTFNPTDARLDPNSSSAESSSIIMHDFTSNGFKTRTTSSDWNASGGTFIYMAFGQSIVGSNNVPCTAR
jgi:hypothetical protein